MTLARKPGPGLKSSGSTWQADFGPAATQVVPGNLVPGPYPLDTTGAVSGNGLVFNGTKFVPGVAGLANAISQAYDFQPPGDLAHNYAADANYASPYTNHDTADDGTGAAFTASGQLGAGDTHVPIFYALDPTHTSAIALNGTDALRITHAATADSGRAFPETVACPAIWVPLPPMDSCTVVATIRTNASTIAPGSAMGAMLRLVGKGSSTVISSLGTCELSALGGTTKEVYADVYAANENLPITTGGQTAGTWSMQVKIVFDRINCGVFDNSGPTLLRGKQAIVVGAGMRAAGLVFGCTSRNALPGGTFWAELAALSITGTRSQF